MSDYNKSKDVPSFIGANDTAIRRFHIKRILARRIGATMSENLISIFYDGREHDELSLTKGDIDGAMETLKKGGIDLASEILAVDSENALTIPYGIYMGKKARGIYGENAVITQRPITPIDGIKQHRDRNEVNLTTDYIVSLKLKESWDTGIITDPQVARIYIESLRWPSGPVCSHCGAVAASRRMWGGAARDGLYKCYDCRQQFTVTVKTLMNHSHIPLHKWLIYIKVVLSTGGRANARQMSEALCLRYHTSWKVREKIEQNLNALSGYATSFEDIITHNPFVR